MIWPDGVVKLWDLETVDGFPVADWREHSQGTFCFCVPVVCVFLEPDLLSRLRFSQPCVRSSTYVELYVRTLSTFRAVSF